MFNSKWSLQILFAAAAATTILLFATVHSGTSNTASEQLLLVHKVVKGQEHISKLWPWSSSSGTLGRAWVRDHVERSERIYQTMVAQRQELDDDFERSGSNKDLFPCVGGLGYRNTPFTIWDWTTAAFNCPHSVQRVGRLGDGGKWICGLEVLEALPARKSRDEPSPCVIYSFGIFNESSLEDGLLARAQGCEIWGYDFSVDDFGPQLNRSAEYVHRAHFIKAGIAGVTDDQRSPPFYSIQDLLRRNSHDHVDILKMDIEGYEFDAMRSIIDAFRRPPGTSIAQGGGGGPEAGDPPLSVLEDDGLGEVPIAQLIVEIHLDPGRFADTPAFMSWWEELEGAGFRATWTEPNLLVSTMPLYDSFPRYAEVSIDA
ncbi:methyltransferase domain-containing protein [Microdochium trichocladiopsis]|uniref:Methyltransferase domain-containing protein n=1 Tax=Microdochium trichocladiopsis TaxID=1682393 RepID=A0A9P8Y2L6_9PEZI|nr:methyltransferase domain-containing protein [Microdochium trichocladiopsis]KAH7028050.1 methyltransferase domain-containing protein [Microdochium trichocladiopsis]